MAKITTKIILCTSLLVFTFCAHAAVMPPKQVPEYVTQGFTAYKQNGYRAGVEQWLHGSPYHNAAQLLANCQYLKNIEMLYGHYIGYRILMVKQTISSNFVYAEMKYKRQIIFVGFTSQRRGQKWVLSNVRFDRQQRLGTAPAPQ